MHSPIRTHGALTATPGAASPPLPPDDIPPTVASGRSPFCRATLGGDHDSTIAQVAAVQAA